MDSHPSKLGTRYALLGTLVALLGAPPAAARQPSPQPSPPGPYQSISVFETPGPQVVPTGRPAGPNTAAAECDRPAELPPLLSVPRPTPPQASGPRDPAGEYDHGYFYLPEQAPEMMRAANQPCGPTGRFWLSPTLELGGSKAASVPALVRAGSPNGPAVYGNEHLTTPFRAGLGLNGGVWLDAEQVHGIDGSFYYLGQGGNNTLLFSPGATYFLPTANGGAFPLSDPAAGYAGSYQAGLITHFSSADVDYRQNVLCGPGGRVDALVGYRYGNLGETFEVYGKRLGPGGEIVRFRDDAKATNQFHGGQIGLAGEYRFDRWYVGATGKVAFGTVFTNTALSGMFRVNGTVIPYGFYARPGTAGETDSSRFGVMPTVGLTFGRQLGEHARVYVGYNLLYLTGVTRGPDVLTPLPNVLAANPQAVSPAASVQRNTPASDFWVQSLSLGLEWRY
ncbi:MAG: hypothetical protein JWO38_7887 [Gemmataceae bacterium]|nr:hypothetical protein [Gemmataceae bacterium]